MCYEIYIKKWKKTNIKTLIYIKNKLNDMKTTKQTTKRINDIINQNEGEDLQMYHFDDIKPYIKGLKYKPVYNEDHIETFRSLFSENGKLMLDILKEKGYDIINKYTVEEGMYISFIINRNTLLRNKLMTLKSKISIN
jgi:hypothetical protein